MEIFQPKGSLQAAALTFNTDLDAALKLAYEPNGFFLSKFAEEAESREYGACTFELNGLRIKFRTAKITPTKNGQFVTLWKRIGFGPIMPYEETDPIDFFIISVRAAGHFGQFIFPKTILCEKGIVSTPKKEGKRAMRIYPPWDKADNSQAKRTQHWQLLYFVEFEPHQPGNILRLQKLLITDDVFNGS